jgi:hypothetical protein
MNFEEIQLQVNTLSQFLTLIINHINTLETRIRILKNAGDLIDEEEEDEEEDY